MNDDLKELPPLEQMLKTATVAAASCWARFRLGLPENLAAEVDQLEAEGWRPVVAFANTPRGWRSVFSMADRDGNLKPIGTQQSTLNVAKLN